MRSDVSVFLTVGALFLLRVLSPTAARGQDGIEAGQQGEGRWVPSFSITGGALIQNQRGLSDSFQFEDGGTTPVPLQGIVTGSDLAVAPFVGGGIEVMSPALPIPTRPRLFLSGELLPTFASDREVAVKGDPGCITGPRVGDACALPPAVPPPNFTFTESAAQGQGATTTTTFDLLVFGANFGVAFPAQIFNRQLRIKPSVGWINYKVEADGMMVDAACSPAQLPPADPTLRVSRCTNRSRAPQPVVPGFLRETTLTASDSQIFNAIGPGLDIELDVVRWRQLGVSLFLGGRAYRTLGDRTIEFDTSQAYSDELGNDVAFANWEVDVDPWMYRAHVGIRFQWLGSPN